MTSMMGRWHLLVADAGYVSVPYLHVLHVVTPSIGLCSHLAGICSNNITHQMYGCDVNAPSAWSVVASHMLVLAEEYKNSGALLYTAR